MIPDRDVLYTWAVGPWQLAGGLFLLWAGAVAPRWVPVPL